MAIDLHRSVEPRCPNTMIRRQLRTDPTPLPAAGRTGWRVFAAVFTLPLLFVGGSVTTYRVGMAVPDWPTTFGINMFLYDFWNAPSASRSSTRHRLYGAAVGLATIVPDGLAPGVRAAALDEGARASSPWSR